MASSTDLSVSDLARISRSFERSHPAEILEWAAATFGGELVFTASFEDSVLIDLLAKAAPATEVVLIDTQYLFAETLWFAEELRARYDLNLHIVTPLDSVKPDNRWQLDVDECCGVRKVEPLNRVLAERAAWVTGIRRVDAPTRADAPIVSHDLVRSVVKINPLATWTDDQMASYETEHRLLKNPLVDRGYLSIGCWPCTRPVAPGQDRRAGRWAGQQKVECGLHASVEGSLS